MGCLSQHLAFGWQKLDKAKTNVALVHPFQPLFTKLSFLGLLLFSGTRKKKSLSSKVAFRRKYLLQQYGPAYLRTGIQMGST